MDIQEDNKRDNGVFLIKCLANGYNFRQCESYKINTINKTVKCYNTYEFMIDQEDGTCSLENQYRIKIAPMGKKTVGSNEYYHIYILNDYYKDYAYSDTIGVIDARNRDTIDQLLDYQLRSSGVMHLAETPDVYKKLMSLIEDADKITYYELDYNMTLYNLIKDSKVYAFMCNSNGWIQLISGACRGSYSHDLSERIIPALEVISQYNILRGSNVL